MPANEWVEAERPPHRARRSVNGARSEAPELLREPTLRRLSDVRPEQIRWLWPGRLPLGKLSLIGGDGGLGKSLIIIDIAARLTTGRGWPDGAAGVAPMSVLILTAEDDLADTVRPRMDAAGGDAGKVMVLESVRRVLADGAAGGEEAFNLADDLPMLEEALARTAAGAVFIDPLAAYLGETDSHTDARVRQVLRPLSELAGRTGAGVIGVMHLNKAVGKASHYRWTASVAFLNTARAAHLVAPDRDDPDGRRRLFIPQKQNLSVRPTGLAYVIEGYPMIYEGLPLDPARIAWQPGAIDLSADDALAERDSVVDEAVEFLRSELAQAHPLGLWTEARVQAAARGAGISWAAIRRAKRPAGVRSRKAIRAEHPDSPWIWELIAVEQSYKNNMLT